MIKKLISIFYFSYDLPSICDCSQECVAALVGDEITPLNQDEMTRKPCQVAVELLHRVVSIHGQFTYISFYIQFNSIQFSSVQFNSIQFNSI